MAARSPWSCGRFLVTWEDSTKEVSPEEAGVGLREKGILVGETTWGGEFENNNKNNDVNQVSIGGILVPRYLDNLNTSTHPLPSSRFLCLLSEGALAC